MENIKYLENDICEFEPMKDIDYSTKKNIITTSLFRMSSGGYKNFMKYLNGIKLVSELSKQKNLEVRIFIDRTIRDDPKTMSFLKKLDNVNLILYKCPDFLVDKEHHVSVFGTLVRFFPLFNFPNNDARTVFIADADSKEEYIVNVFKLYDILKKNKILKKVHLAYNGRYFHINVSSDKITKITDKGKEYFLPYCLATKFIGTRRISKKPFLKYMEKLKLYMNDTSRPGNILSDYYIDPSKLKIRCENNICFGVEEYFINKILFKYMIKREIPFCYSNIYDLAQFYYFKHPKNMNENLISVSKEEYINTFNNYMKTTGLNKYSFEEIDKGIYIDDKKDDSGGSTVATPFMKEYSKKMIPLLERVDKEKDYRIYAESQLDSMKQVDYKTYFKIRFIRFIGGESRKDLILNSTVFEDKLEI